MKSIFFTTLMIFLLFSACTNSSDKTTNNETQNNQVRQIFSDTNTEFTIKVAFEVGATPNTGAIGLTANDTWDITKTSYQALFQNHTGRLITVPNTVGAFTQIADQAKTTWTSLELITLGQSVSPAVPVVSNKATVAIIFVNGTYLGNQNILGIHFSGYGFAFVFKDVVTSVGGTSIDQKYVEQGTVVHEIGHVIGLVNNGVPLTSSHEDAAHPRHSSNSNCIMYWTVESSNSILSFLTNNILANRLNLFEVEVLNDARAYHP